MDEKLKQLETLLTMFDARDSMWAKHNKQIAGVIAPTVLAALYELFELDVDSIEWVDLQIMDSIVLIVCNVTYDPVNTQSSFLHRIDEAALPDTPIQVQRYLRIGVPLAIVFSPKDEIKEFLMRIPVETPDDEDVSEEAFAPKHPELTDSVQRSGTKAKVHGFDTSTLDEDQLKRLMLYHHTVENTKQ